MQEQATLKDLLEFPCKFTFKVMGYAKPELPDLILAVIQKHAPGDYSPSVKPSAKGTYNAVSVSITATSIEQVEILYKELGEIDIVRMVL
ncbi:MULTISPECIES: DUF493 family protein YbeD [Vibrio]|uniref:UPF0250 protein GFB47_03175 n=1 Tax=Vibrio algicola TaxID=2662262 RepID=A0A5Q0TCA7_9VIBR|nr:MULTISPECIES: DUF493 family protein YbeD [Vibrio]MBD1575031.1 DUF493 family protein [Vibrio sp. S11_S32]